MNLLDIANYFSVEFARLNALCFKACTFARYIYPSSGLPLRGGSQKDGLLGDIVGRRALRKTGRQSHTEPEGTRRMKNGDSGTAR